MRIHSSCVVTDNDIMRNEKHEIEIRVIDELTQHLAQQIVRLVHKEVERINIGPTPDDPFGHSTRFSIELEVNPCRSHPPVTAEDYFSNLRAIEMRKIARDMGINPSMLSDKDIERMRSYINITLD